MRRQVPGVVVLVLVLAVAAVVALASLRAATGLRGELISVISADDRALLNPLNMMKMVANVNKATLPGSIYHFPAKIANILPSANSDEQQVPKRAILEAQVAARQQAIRDKATLVKEAHTESVEGRHTPGATPKISIQNVVNQKVENYDKQAGVLTVQSKEDSQTASVLAAQAQELAAEAKKEDQMAIDASTRGKQLIQQASEKSKRLKEQAKIEAEQATHLVVYAKKLAQRMVKEEALDEMKKWMASSAAKQSKIANRNKSDRHAERAERQRNAQKQSRARARLPLTALRSRMVAKPAHMPTDGDKIRNEFAEWSTSKLKTYAKDHDLFTKTQFCNSRAVAHNPSFTELRRAFGPDWRDVPPRVASLAAVNSCMEALGLRARQSRPANMWDHGPLKGEADNVRECALGVSKVLSPLALGALCCFGFVSCHSIVSATHLFCHFFFCPGIAFCHIPLYSFAVAQDKEFRHVFSFI